MSKELEEQVKELSIKFLDVKSEIHKAIIGQEHLLKSLLIALLCNGHILLEGLPGLAKTLSIKTLSKVVSVDFKRVQFTQDLLPGDLLGTTIYDQKSNEFIIKKGPMFTNFLLADEINRAPAKVQSALLEAMQEKQVTIAHETFYLPEIFLVLATQNPIEQEGTYPLPEAQLDRFMLKVKVDYPNKVQELEILNSLENDNASRIKNIIDGNTILEARKIVNQIHLDSRIKKYIIDIVFASRKPQDYGLDISEFIQYGASPRASICLAICAKAYAFLEGRTFVIPEDIKSIAEYILNHRMVLSYQAIAEEIKAEELIQNILDKVKIL